MLIGQGLTTLKIGKSYWFKALSSVWIIVYDWPPFMILTRKVTHVVNVSLAGSGITHIWSVFYRHLLYLFTSSTLPQFFPASVYVIAET